MRGTTVLLHQKGGEMMVSSLFFAKETLPKSPSTPPEFVNFIPQKMSEETKVKLCGDHRFI